MFQAHKVNGSCTQTFPILNTKYTKNKFKIGWQDYNTIQDEIQKESKVDALYGKK